MNSHLHKTDTHWLLHMPELVVSTQWFEPEFWREQDKILGESRGRNVTWFVGEKEEDQDGEIIFFKIPKSEIKYFDSDTVSVVSNIAWAKSDFEIAPRYDGDYKKFHHKNNHHALKLMHDIKQEKPHFLERINPEHVKSVFV